MATGPLKVGKSAGVATVTIDHPPTNLVDAPFIRGLVALLDEVEHDNTTRVLLFVSADPDFFLMHGDVKGIMAIKAGAQTPVTEPNFAAAMFERLRQSRVVSIGAIDGAARGGGAEFLTALDLRYGSPRTVFGQPEVAMGILPGAGGTSRLPRLLGRSKTLEIILTGRDVGAEEALGIGWLDAVVPREQLMEHAQRIASRIAAMPPDSIAAVKRVVNISIGSLQETLVAETNALNDLIAKGMHMAPMQHFLDAGGQTREEETQRMSELIDAMLKS
jgi:enoyl-CoA hydratase/carnithine racemase